MWMPRLLLLVALFSLISGLRPANAGGPFNVDSLNNTGVPLTWKDGILEWYIEEGPLSTSVDNATGAQWVKDQFKTWSGAQLTNSSDKSEVTTSFTPKFVGTIKKDIDLTNYKPYITPGSGEKKTIIIFDANGDIVADLLGEENRKGIAGLTAAIEADPAATHYTRGFSLVNGLLLNTNLLADDQNGRYEMLKASILHELGHLIGLDHTQVNMAIAKPCQDDIKKVCPDGNYIPTMYPRLVTASQGTLSRDDKSTLSWLYPKPEFGSDFCVITGEIFDGKGRPLKGVNVVAVRSGDTDTIAKTDAHSAVSGVMFPGCAGDSRYAIYGIVPGHKYEVRYEPIAKEWTGPSSIEPFDPPNGGFEAGPIHSPSDEDAVSCGGGGDTIEMASVTINTTNRCVEAGKGLNKAMVISGTTYGSDGKPLPEVTVYIQADAENSISNSADKSIWTCTDPTEEYCAAACSGADGTFEMDTSNCYGNETQMVMLKGTTMKKIVDLNCISGGTCALSADQSTFPGEASKSSSCSLMPHGNFSCFGAASLAIALAAIVLRRRRTG